MHFSILLFEASMHYWKYYSWMSLSSVKTASLMAYTPSKRFRLVIRLILGKSRSKCSEFIPVRQCSFRSGTAGCLGRCATVHCCREEATILLATRNVKKRGNGSRKLRLLRCFPLILVSTHLIQKTHSRNFQTDSQTWYL